VGGIIFSFRRSFLYRGEENERKNNENYEKISQNCIEEELFERRIFSFWRRNFSWVI